MKMTTTMLMRWLYLISHLCICVWGKKHSERLYEFLFQNSSYNKVLIPTVRDNDTLMMNLTFLPRGISEFDEVTGKISIAMGLDIRWIDSSLRWNPLEYGGVSHLVVPEDHVWTPVLTLANPVDRIPVFPEDSFPVRIYANGMMIWIRGGTISITCQPNVRYYPYDQHTCRAKFLTIDRIRNELMLRPGMRSAILDKNEEWDIADLKYHSCFFDVYSCSTFEIKIKRRPEFSILNTCIPIICLGILNACVFLIPPESGERVSFAITVLLSFAVFMTIFSSILPKNSDPVPILSYILMFMMIESGIIVVLTIVGLRIFHRRNDSDCPSKTPCCITITRCVDKIHACNEDTPLNVSCQQDTERRSETPQGTHSCDRLRIFDLICFHVSLLGFVVLVSSFAILVKTA